MKPLFFDQSVSYHPVKACRQTVEKDVHPHYFIDEDFGSGEQVDLQKKVSTFFCLDDQRKLILTPGGEGPLDAVLECHYHQEIFSSGKGHIVYLRPYAQKTMPIIYEKFKLLGVNIECISVDKSGHLTTDLLKQTITPRTSLVSFPWVDPVTGVIQPIEDLVRYCHEQGVACHVDISHAIGKLYIYLQDCQADYLTFDAKVFGGPYQIGGCFFRKTPPSWLRSLRFPLEQQGLEKALIHAEADLDKMHLEVARLRRDFERHLKDKIPEINFLFQGVDCLSNHVMVHFPYVTSEYLLYLLDQEKLYARIVDDHAISFTFPSEVTPEDIDLAVDRIYRCYSQATMISRDFILKGTPI